MTSLTSAQVLALAPDDASSKAARGLTKPAKWVTLGAFEGGLWGECQGSGSKPYQVMVDANGFASKCSCPSRKFPCKHGLALMLMFADQIGTFASTPSPWILEWLAGRQERAEKQAVKQEMAATAPPPDPAKVAKKQEARLEKMQAGTQYLSLWMRDLLREGISDLPSRPSSFWNEIAARMVDAQVPGLARRVEQMESLLYSGSDWPTKMLAAMGRTQLLLDSFANYSSLSPELQSDIRVALGWPQDKDSALAGEKVEDVWKVVGLIFETNGPLHERRAWLSGQKSQRTALLLDFSHGARKFDIALILGTEFPGVLGFFPGAAPQRAMVIEIKGPANAVGNLDGATTFVAGMGSIAQRWAANPFAHRQPLALRQARLCYENSRWSVADCAGQQVPTRLTDQQGWRLAASAGGAPADLFGEWQECFAPVAAVVGSQWINLSE